MTGAEAAARNSRRRPIATDVAVPVRKVRRFTETPPSVSMPAPIRGRTQLPDLALGDWPSRRSRPAEGSQIDASTLPPSVPNKSTPFGSEVGQRHSASEQSIRYDGLPAPRALREYVRRRRAVREARARTYAGDARAVRNS